MIFFGAESGNNKLLTQMDKGGKQTGEKIKTFAARIKKFGEGVNFGRSESANERIPDRLGRKRYRKTC